MTALASSTLRPWWERRASQRVPIAGGAERALELDAVALRAGGELGAEDPLGLGALERRKACMALRLPVENGSLSSAERRTGVMNSSTRARWSTKAPRERVERAGVGQVLDDRDDALGLPRADRALQRLAVAEVLEDRARR